MAQETFMKRLMGKTDVENAFQRLDTLTKEENLMAAARIFEATQHVEEVLHQVDDNVEVAKRGTPIVSVSLKM